MVHKESTGHNLVNSNTWCELARLRYSRALVIRLAKDIWVV